MSLKDILLTFIYSYLPMTVHLLHTPEAVADLLSVSVLTLKTWRYKKKGPPYINMNGGVGGVRYPDDLLAKWQQDQFDQFMEKQK